MNVFDLKRQRSSPPPNSIGLQTDSDDGVSDLASSSDVTTPTNTTISSSSPQSIASSSPNNDTHQSNSQSSAGSADSGIGLELDRLHAQASLLALDTIQVATSERPEKPPNSAARKMRELVAKLQTRHEILYNSLVRKLVVPPPNKTQSLPLPKKRKESDSVSAAKDTTPDKTLVHCAEAPRQLISSQVISAVAAEMFADRTYNYGRLVALFAFCSVWAKYLHEHELAERYELDTLPTALADYVVNHGIGTWMLQRHGFEGLFKDFPDEPDWEGALFKGLLVTGMGLGVLAGLRYALK